MTYPLEFMGCIACAAGLPYSLNTLDMRTSSQMEADQLAFTLGVSSLAALPVASVGWAAMGLRPVVTGFGLGAGFDGVGQVVGGKEYRPAQTLVAGVTGGLAYPLAGGALMNTLLGGVVGGANTSVNNYVYSEDRDVVRAVGVGALAGGFGTAFGQGVSGLAASVLPYRIGASVIDPNKALLLQNIGTVNPYPAYIGEAAGNAVSGGLPILFERIGGDGK
ncbi:hypothetical protein [Ectopseudomonas alcaliphila]|nr:hypothetical protein [Pseudomonas alcaliphila]SDF98047.1 hypothetical protein SAMN05216575_1173 [Pseudomonas alcaliphila]